MANTDYPSVEAYLAAQAPSARPVLERVRSIIRKALKGATERISYQIPEYSVDGAMVLYFAGYQRHYSIYPATPRVLAALGDELTKHLHSKATLRFSLAEPVPTQLIMRIAKLRAAEAAELAQAKAAKKATPKKAVAAKAVASKAGANRAPAKKATAKKTETAITKKAGTKKAVVPKKAGAKRAGAKQGGAKRR